MLKNKYWQGTVRVASVFLFFVGILFFAFAVMSGLVGIIWLFENYLIASSAVFIAITLVAMIIVAWNEVLKNDI